MPLLLFLILASFWGGSFVAIKYVVLAFPPVTGAAYRVILALAALTIIYVTTKKPFGFNSPKRHAMWWCGFFYQALPFSLLFWGERFVSPGLAGILNGTTPLWTFVLALLFLRQHETFTPQKIVGLCLGFVGIAVIFYPKITLSGDPNELWGVLAILGMAISYGIGNILNRRLIVKNTDMSLYSNLYQQHVASAVILIILSCGLEGWLEISNVPRIMNNGVALSALLYLSVCSNAIAWLIYFYLMRKWDAIRASAVAYLIPPISIAADFLLFKTVPAVTDIVGFVVVLSGVVLLQARKKW